MHLLSLLLACSQPAAAPAVPAGPELAIGLTATDTTQSSWTIPLKAGETVHLGALSADTDVALAITPPTGSATVALSRLAEHASASLRFIATTDGSYGVTVAPTVPVERASVSLIRREPMPGTICDQLQTLSAGDPWALPGAETKSTDGSTRSRSLVAVMPWAAECTVNRMGDMDVGPSCRLPRLNAVDGASTYKAVEADFKACHAGWDVMDESDGPTRELVAEKGGELHFLRLRETPEGWQVSTGAMPGM